MYMPTTPLPSSQDFLISYLIHFRPAVALPIKTTQQDLPLSWPSIHCWIAESPPRVIRSHSLSETGWFPSTTPAFLTCDARQLSGL